jgi:hypothetical protein
MLTEYGLPTTSASGFRQRKRKPSVVCFCSREAEDNVPACHHSGSGRMTSNREIVFRFLDPLPSARHHCDAKIVAYTSTTHFRVSGATSNEERRCRNNTRSLAARFTSTSVQIDASGSAQAILLAKIGAPAPRKRAFCPSRGLCPPQPIVALAHSMQSSACVRPLVTSIGRAELLQPGSASAHWGAVALPTIAMAADAENDATATTVTVSQHNVGHGHPRSNHATPYTR